MRRATAPTAFLLGFLAAFSGVTCAQAPGPGGERGSYTFQLGDVVQVQVASREEFRQEIMVFTVGAISYPGVGKLTFHGKTPAAIEGEIAAALATRGILNADVSVLVARTTPGNVYVQGAVDSPSAVALPLHRELRLSQLIASVGGLTESADPAKIKLWRNDPKQPGSRLVQTIDYAQVAAGTNPQGDIVLQDGDSIFVGVRVVGSCWVTGEVQRPGEYKFPPDNVFSVLKAIVRAGGANEYGNLKKVKIIHKNGQSQVIDVGEALREGDMSQDLPLVDGDWISVPKRMF